MTEPSNQPTLAVRLAGEAIGTFFLLATVVGSGIMAANLAGGNIAIALLGNTIPTGAILVVLILVFGATSGAHFNPAVTVSFLIRGDINLPHAGAYIVTQIIAGIAGAWCAHLMFDISLLQQSTTMRTGAGQWLSEVVATFGLVMTILGCLKHRPEAIPMGVGLYISAAYWFTASTSFANPAVTIARTLTDTFSGIYPAHAPAFIAAQVVGAVAATLVMAWITKED